MYNDYRTKVLNMEGSFSMSVRGPIFLDAETWAHLKALAGADLRSPHNYLQVLVWREWSTRSVMGAEIVSKQPCPGVAALHPIPPFTSTRANEGHHQSWAPSYTRKIK